MERIRVPFEAFLRDQTTSSLLLFTCMVAALALANSPYAEAFSALLHTPIGVYLGDYRLEKSLSHWINDGLMPLFFFILGLEMKREILAGEFQDPRRGLLVICCAIGGMAAPALVYLALNSNAPALQGWGIPMATDTAFALGVLVLLGKRVPPGLVTLLVAIAIVDDMGAVLVIALFYTDTVDWSLLGSGSLALVLMLLLNVAGIRRAWPYALMSAALWAAFLFSGVHTTVAGILAALTVPASPSHGHRQFMKRIKKLLSRVDDKREPRSPILGDAEAHELIEEIENTAYQATTPLQRWERTLETPVGLFVLPLFALANAGLSLTSEELLSALAAPATLGVGLGLVLGKFVGILGGCLLAIWTGLGRLPEGVLPGHVGGMALVGGMGFTMSMFIATLAFGQNPELLAQAKVGILGGTFAAGALGALWLVWFARHRDSPSTP
nr:Na+/H+ antiporter NhaA [Motiliproteus sp. SC1-56]